VQFDTVLQVNENKTLELTLMQHMQNHETKEESKGVDLEEEEEEEEELEEEE